MRRLIGLAAGLGLLLSISAGAAFAAAGPPSIGFYADGSLYRTLDTPTDFTNTGAPASSFEPIYVLGDGLMNVAAAAPGDPGFRGGRWMVLPVTWNVAPVQLTSGQQVLAYAAAGELSIASTPIKEFECPVIAVPGNH